MKRIPIREATIGNTYFTSRGMKIEVLRHRSEDDIIVKSITSGGHEIVLPGGTMVTGEQLAVNVAAPLEPLVKPKPVENTFENLVFHIVNASKVSTDEIVNLTGYAKEIVEVEVAALLAPAIGNNVENING